MLGDALEVICNLQDLKGLLLISWRQIPESMTRALVKFMPHWHNSILGQGWSQCCGSAVYTMCAKECLDVCVVFSQ